MPELEQLFKRFKDRVDFRVVYIREAHPTDGWQVPQNRKDGVLVATAKTTDDRARAASVCTLGLKISIPVVIDGLDDKVEKAYAGWPDRIYIVDKAGKIAYKGAPGPGGFRPREAERSLIEIFGQ